MNLVEEELRVKRRVVDFERAGTTVNVINKKTERTDVKGEGSYLDTGSSPLSGGELGK